MLICTLEFHESQNWSFHSSLRAWYLKEQNNGCRNVWKTGKEADKAAAFPLGRHFGRIQRREFSVLNRLPVLSKALTFRWHFSPHFRPWKSEGRSHNGRLLRTWAGSFKFTFSSSVGILGDQKGLVHPWGQQLRPTDRLHSSSCPLAPRCFPAMANLNPSDVLEFHCAAGTSSQSLTVL